MFKNAIAYAVTDGFRVDPEILGRMPALPCAPIQARTAGFAKPCDHATDELVHKIGRHDLICFETEDRLLPGSVVASEVEERAAALASSQGYKPGRKQLKEIKERVVEELLPKSFTQKRRTLAAFTGGFLIVDTSSSARAEALIETLRRALDELPLMAINTQHRINGKMVEWLLGNAPYGLTVDDFSELEMVDDRKPTITYKRAPLDETEMQRRIACGYVPRAIGITLGERMSFKIDDSLCLKQLIALDKMKAEAESPKHAEEMFDADLALMLGELVQVFSFLIGELGGLVAPEPDLVTEAANAANEQDSDDPLYVQAVAIVVSNQRASISLVQRHLRIGYNRAARLIEDMESAGIVSAMDSSGTRKVFAANDERKAA